MLSPGGTGAAGVAWGLHTHVAVGTAGCSVPGCLKAEDVLLDAGRALGLACFSRPRSCDLCRTQGCPSPGAL